ncbi:ABC transporter ATP-binding protein [Microbacterium sp. NPDC078428]|uniref:ABC transporter ATP-binding protein n=1 Tax=Microbacterium sp. NPDC078428 TaxID=3364190 RepID=UPI0037CB7A6E
MPEGEVLEFSGVTKSFGRVSAVDGFTARVEPGVVTGFLGPNGAGKTTTMRILLGLVRATSGRALIGGKAYAELADPLRTVGAALEAASFHPGRTAANHLKVYAHAAGLPAGRVDDALGAVGLSDVGGRKVGGYSLGMRQRLGLAFALLGDPGVLVLDEPANGLDPEGIIWMRGLLRELARQGRTVFVSSHLLTEVAQTAQQLLMISHGRLVFQGGVDELSDPADQAVLVDSPDRAGLAAALAAAGIETDALRSGLTVRGGDPAEIGRLALDAGVPLSSLQRRGPSLEEVFLDLVNGARVHPSAAATVAPAMADAAPTTDAPDESAAADDAAGSAPVDAPEGSEGEDDLVSEAPEVEILAPALDAQDLDGNPAHTEPAHTEPADTEPTQADPTDASADADEFLVSEAPDIEVQDPALEAQTLDGEPADDREHDREGDDR